MKSKIDLKKRELYLVTELGLFDCILGKTWRNFSAVIANSCLKTDTRWTATFSYTLAKNHMNAT